MTLLESILFASERCKRRALRFGDRLKHLSLPKRRNKKKNHSTNRERSLEAREKARLSKKKVAENDAKFRAYKSAVADYYAGRIASHPGDKA